MPDDTNAPEATSQVSREQAAMPYRVDLAKGPTHAEPHRTVSLAKIPDGTGSSVATVSLAKRPAEDAGSLPQPTPIGNTIPRSEGWPTHHAPIDVIPAPGVVPLPVPFGETVPAAPRALFGETLPAAAVPRIGDTMPTAVIGATVPKALIGDTEPGPPQELVGDTLPAGSVVTSVPPASAPDAVTSPPTSMPNQAAATLAWPAAPSSQTSLGASDATIPPRRRIRLSLLIGSASVLAILVVVVVVVALTSLRLPPFAAAAPPGATEDAPASTAASAPVEAYVQALVVGDAAAAFALAAPEGSVSSPLLAPDVYARAGHPTDFSIASASVSGDSAQIQATVELGGRRIDMPFTVRRTADASSPFGGWTIANAPLASIAVGDVTGVRTIDSVPVDLSGVTPGSTLPALVGTYTFDPPAPTAFSEYGDAVTADATYDPAAATSVSFTATLSDTGREAVIAGVSARIDHCMLSDAFQPKDCPRVLEMKDPKTYAVTDLTRRWIAHPRYAVVGSETEGYAVVVRGGDIHIDFRRRVTEDEPWTPDQLTQRGVFDAASPDGVRVPFTLGPTGPSYDFSAL